MALAADGRTLRIVRDRGRRDLHPGTTSSPLKNSIDDAIVQPLRRGRAGRRPACRKGLLHVHRAIELRALADPDTRCHDVALNIRTRADQDGSRAIQIALDSALDRDARGVDIAYDHTVHSDRET